MKRMKLKITNEAWENKYDEFFSFFFVGPKIIPGTSFTVSGCCNIMLLIPRHSCEWLGSSRLLSLDNTQYAHRVRATAGTSHSTDYQHVIYSKNITFNINGRT